MDTVLKGLRVLDFGQYLAGPMVARFLSDFGADVIRIDPPGGPAWKHPMNGYLQRDKHRIELDLKRPADVALAEQFIREADVVIEGFRPGVLDRLGVRQDEWSRARPQLVWCSLPGFGATDPRAALPGWEGLVCSAAGLYPPGQFATTGSPTFSPLPLASTFAAFVAAHRIVAALVGRQRFGRGECIEVPLFDAAFEALGVVAEIPQSHSLAYEAHTRSKRANIAGYHLAGDGRYVAVDAPARGSQALLSHYLPGATLLEADDEQLASIGAEFEGIWQRRSAEQWERFAQEELGAAVGVVQTHDDWLDDLHARESRCIIDVDDPERGPSPQVGPCVLLGAVDGSSRQGRESSGTERLAIAQLLESWRVPRAEFFGSAEEDGDRPALDGVRVLDASILLAGPTTTRVLAQYGADVIKIDSAGLATGRIDPLKDDVVCLVGHRTVNAGKRMMFLDLKSADGQSVLTRLISEMDVVHHNFTPAAAARLGLGRSDVSRLQGQAICSTTSLHSLGGRRFGYRGHDLLAQDVTGMSLLVGGDAPRYAPLPLNDNACGHLSAFGVLLALLHRTRTGQVCDVNAALSRTATVLQALFLSPSEQSTPAVGARWDSFGWGPFDRLYEANDGWLYLAARTTDVVQRLQRVPGLESLGGSDTPERAVVALLEQLIALRPVAYWVDAFEKAGLPAHRYMSIEENMRDATVTSRRLLMCVDHPGQGTASGIGIAAHGRGRGDVLTSRRPGSDTVAVLKEFGFADRVAQLLRCGVVADDADPIVTISS